MALQRQQSAQGIDPSKMKVVVIGGGPGGYPAAIRAAQMGAQVTLIENRDLGGTCLNRGCIPTKALLHSANLFHQTKNAASSGILTAKVTLDFPKVMEVKGGVVKNLVGGLGSILKSNGIAVVKGTGAFANAQTVRIVETNQEIKADRIIIATGSVPLKLPIKGADLPGVITSDEALSLTKLPKSILIIGGGVIGIEFAQIFNRMGTQVTVVEMLPQIIPNEDSEIVAKLKAMLVKEGIAIHTDTTVKEIKEKGNKKTVSYGKTEAVVDMVLQAVGRAPFTEGLGADTIGLQMEKGTVAVNEYLETNVPGVYAIGDVIGNYMLAHVATSEGEHAAQNALGNPKAMDYKAVPRALYTSPELGSVGLTEKEAKEKYGEIKVGKFPLAASGKALILGEKGGMVKVVAEPKYDEVVGVHILGPHATDLIAEAVLGIQLEAALEEFAHTIHAHPTLSESIMEAALDAEGKAIHVPAKKKK
jgi:dihydrolipoamide dehydrogenase